MPATSHQRKLNSSPLINTIYSPISGPHLRTCADDVRRNSSRRRWDDKFNSPQFCVDCSLDYCHNYYRHRIHRLLSRMLLSIPSALSFLVFSVASSASYLAARSLSDDISFNVHSSLVLDHSQPTVIPGAKPSSSLVLPSFTPMVADDFVQSNDTFSDRAGIIAGIIGAISLLLVAAGIVGWCLAKRKNARTIMVIPDPIPDRHHPIDSRSMSLSPLGSGWSAKEWIWGRIFLDCSIFLSFFLPISFPFLQLLSIFTLFYRNISLAFGGGECLHDDFFFFNN